MRNILFGGIISLFFFSCSSKTKKVEKVEEKLYECLMSSLNKAEEKKLDSIITAYEKYLINKEIIASADAESYWNLYKNIANTGRYDFSNKFDFANKVSFLNRKDSIQNKKLVDCHESIFASEKYLNSNQYALLKQIEATGKANSPVVVAKSMVKHLTVEDFELKYNRLNTLMFIERLK